jgi:hypothetical protein
MVTPSPWPLFASVAALLITVGGVMYMHRYNFGGYILILGIVYLLGIVGLWWRVYVVREATFEGKHTFACTTWFKNRDGFIYCFRSYVFFCFFLGFFSF